MASSASVVPAATRQSNFEQGVAYTLHLWPALTLAVQNGWGGPDSSDKRDWFAGAVVDLFPALADAPPPPTPSSMPTAAATAAKAPAAGPATTHTEPEIEDVEAVLLQVMMDEFEVNVDDDSGADVAAQIVRLRAQCSNGVFDEFESLRVRFERARGSKVDQMFKRVQDAEQDTDWETDDSHDDDDDDDNDDDDDDEGADVAMRDAPREKPAPQVDDDGFTMVSRRRK